MSKIIKPVGAENHKGFFVQDADYELVPSEGSGWALICVDDAVCHYVDPDILLIQNLEEPDKVLESTNSFSNDKENLDASQMETPTLGTNQVAGRERNEHILVEARKLESVIEEIDLNIRKMQAQSKEIGKETCQSLSELGLIVESLNGVL